MRACMRDRRTHMGTESGMSFTLCADDFQIRAEHCVIVRLDGSFVKGKVAAHWLCN